MRTSFVLSALALVSSAFGAAIEKRQAQSGGQNIDATVLNFALILEHLENTFYSQGLSNYSASAFTSAGYPAAVRTNIQQIAADEASHVSLLTSALSAAGATPVQACTYNFGVNSVNGFLAVAQVLEGVGVSAYSGAAPLITSGAYLEVAANILTVEARHNAFIRLVNGESPFPAPYDVGITPTAVTTLAAPFFANCPSGSAPPFTPFPSLTIGNSANATQGSTLQVSGNLTAAGNNASLYCSFASGSGTSSSALTNGACQVPQNVTNGQVYVFVTKTAGNISDSTVVAGGAYLDLGPKNNTVIATSANNGSSSGGSSGSSGSSGSQTTTQSGDATAILPKVGGILAMVAVGAFML